MTELQKHRQFIANELLAFSVVTEGMSQKERRIAAEGNAEHILRWITSRPVKRSWWSTIFGRELGL